MKRTYLEEDLELIQKYFPGARATRLRIPLDLTQPLPRISHLRSDIHQDSKDNTGWVGEVVWMS